MDFGPVLLRAAQNSGTTSFQSDSPPRSSPIRKTETRTGQSWEKSGLTSALYGSPESCSNSGRSGTRRSLAVGDTNRPISTAPKQRNESCGTHQLREEWSGSRGRQTNLRWPKFDPLYDNLENYSAVFQRKPAETPENNLPLSRPTIRENSFPLPNTNWPDRQRGVTTNAVDTIGDQAKLRRNSLIIPATNLNQPTTHSSCAATRKFTEKNTTEGISENCVDKNGTLSQSLHQARNLSEDFSAPVSAPNTPLLRIASGDCRANSSSTEETTFVARPYRRTGSDSQLKRYRVRPPSGGANSALPVQTPAVSQKQPDFLARSSAKLKRVFSKGKMDAPPVSPRQEPTNEFEKNNELNFAANSGAEISNKRPNPGEISASENQRISFTSTSTGYSSARSSLRSSIPFACESASFGGTAGQMSPLLKENEALSWARKKCLTAGKMEPTYLDRIAMELLDTERIYVNDLDSVIQSYLNFLLSERDELGVTAVDICQLFGNIEQVFDFNRQFYILLDACRLDLLRMAQCFVDQEAGFEVYADYCTQYPKMVTVLNCLYQKQRVREALGERQMLLNHSLPLGPYLLKPVQRVLKYHLFLQNTLKHWDHSKTSEVKNIQKALDCMTGRAKHINDVKKRQEHAVRVQEIQRTLIRWKNEGCSDLTQYGDLILEDCFRISGSKAKRRIFLFEEMLLITKDKQEGQLTCKDFIMCSSLMLVESVSGDPLAFQVLSFDNPKLQHTLQARTADQKCQWTQELKRLMLEHFSAEIPSRAKEILMAMSAKKTQDPDEKRRPSGPKRQCSVPKYLEKRRKSADPTVDLKVLRKTKSNCTRSASVTDLLLKRSSYSPSEPCPSPASQLTPSSLTLSSDQKRAHRVRVQHFFDSRKFSTETRASPSVSMTSRLIPQRLRRSKSPTSPRVKVRSVTRVNSHRNPNNSPNIGERVPAHSTAKRMQSEPEVTSAEISEPKVEQKFFEASEFPRSEKCAIISAGGKLCRASTGSSSDDSAYGSRANENSARSSDASSEANKNDNVTSWLHSCGFQGKKRENLPPDKCQTSAKPRRDAIELKKEEESAEKTAEIEKAYAHLWEELREFCNEETEKLSSPIKKSSVATKFPVEENLTSFTVANRKLAECSGTRQKSSSVDRNSQIRNTPVNRHFGRQKARSQSREGSTDSRTVEAINRLTDLLKVEAKATSIDKKPIELGSKLERIRPARPEKCEENRMEKAQSLGSLLTPKHSSTPLFVSNFQEVFDDQDTCSSVSSRESLYDTVFEWDLERQLDVLHAWDSEMYVEGQEWSDWLSGNHLTNEQLDAELEPLRACVDIRRSVKQWEDKLNGSQRFLAGAANEISQSEQTKTDQPKNAFLVGIVVVYVVFN